MTIRLLQQSEIAPAASIIAANYGVEYGMRAEQEIAQMFAIGPTLPVFLAAEDAQKIIGVAGYIQSWMDWHWYEIFWVNILPDFQQKGIGKQLVQAAMEGIQQIPAPNQARGILLTACVPGFYEKLGFEKMEEYKKGHWLMRYKISNVPADPEGYRF